MLQNEAPFYKFLCQASALIDVHINKSSLFAHFPWFYGPLNIANIEKCLQDGFPNLLNLCVTLVTDVINYCISDLSEGR